MKKEKGPIQQQLEKGYEKGADTSKTPAEAFEDVIQTAQQEVEAANDLTSARKQRKAAVAQRLNQLREASGLRQRDVAEKIGVNIITLSGYEVGRSEPPEEVLVRLAGLYGVSLDYLLCRTDVRIAFNESEYQAMDTERQALSERLDQLEKELQDIRNRVK